MKSWNELSLMLGRKMTQTSIKKGKLFMWKTCLELNKPLLRIKQFQIKRF